MSALITVLMPVYNAERHLREAIDSILSQTFERFEFVIIDDGSTDGSKEIVRSYSDPRIRFFENKTNLGISASLNRGIALSNCELIARMDADDISYPQRLQKQYDYMVKHPNCALLSCWAKVVSEEKKFIRLERYRSNFYYYNLTFECWMYHPTIMFRKQPVEAVGMYSMRYAEDYDLFWKISTAFEIGNLAEPLLDYRVSSTSLHAVTCRDEYAIASEKNVIRNIRYYLGDDFFVSRSVLQCLRHDFEHVAVYQNTDCVHEALQVMALVTHNILEYRNPNRNENDIKAAHYFKRNFIIAEVCKLLPLKKQLDFIMKTHAWSVVLLSIRHAFRWRMRRLVRMLG